MIINPHSYVIELQFLNAAHFNNSDCEFIGGTERALCYAYNIGLLAGYSPAQTSLIR